eukprot:TRINITY_DN1493_c0_g2_i5.p1 TRINITY_DN1493_c0_g2~~TRINITY_DN1493_c0_g2_i5.p1  ORF type:complete len:338 (+),score=26.45 TRINITY_DN1493_c0_g2_i5:1663-2676(+)
MDCQFTLTLLFTTLSFLTLGSLQQSLTSITFYYRDVKSGLQFTMIQPDASLDVNETKIGLALFQIAISRDFSGEQYWVDIVYNPQRDSVFNNVAKWVLLILILLRLTDMTQWPMFVRTAEETIGPYSLTVEIFGTMFALITYIVNLTSVSFTRRLAFVGELSMADSTVIVWITFAVIIINFFAQLLAMIIALLLSRQHQQISLHIRAITWSTLVLFALWPTFLESNATDVISLVAVLACAFAVIYLNTSAIKIFLQMSEHYYQLMTGVILSYFLVQVVIILGMLIPAVQIWLGGLGQTICVMIALCLDVAVMCFSHFVTDTRMITNLHNIEKKLAFR